MSQHTIGLIINPAAGVGGRVGLKGSDGEEVYRRAIEMGSVPVAPERTRRALRRLAGERLTFKIITCPGEMGERICLEEGFDPEILGGPFGVPSSPEDTIRAAGEFVRRGVELILFTGGDGTARNVFDAVGPDQPVLGIPGGVKIHSGVYAASPAKAADLVSDFLQARGRIRLSSCEVMDLDEESIRADRVSARLYGYMKVPFERGLNQSAKAGSSSSDEVSQDGIASDVINGMNSSDIYLIGPGTTTLAVLEKMRLKGTLLGIDAVHQGKILALDLNEQKILNLMTAHSDKCFKIIATITGRQGFLFGRGNQQFSPEVIRRVGKNGITVLSTENKLLSLKDSPVYVDTGDSELDEELSGYIQIITDFGMRKVYPMSS